MYNYAVADFKSFDKKNYTTHARQFLELLMMQDKLLGTRKEFKVGNWIQQARNLGITPEEKDLYEWNARVQITTWGNRYCADIGKLRDYAHKEWNGLLRDFYYKRWEKYWQVLQDQLDGKLPVLPVGNSSTPTADNPAMTIDWYALEEPWTLAKNTYAASAEGDCIEVAKEAITLINN